MRMLPRCCGFEMKVNMELGRFIEAKCDTCEDVVYVKRLSRALPQMLDD